MAQQLLQWTPMAKVPSFHVGVYLGTAKLKTWGDPVVDLHPRVSRNTAIYSMLQKAEISSGSLFSL